MKPILKPLQSLLFLFLIFPQFILNAQELKLKSFKHLEGYTSARINWTEDKIDINGKKCALLIIKHNFNHFIIEAGKGDEGLEEKGEGETWVWMSPDEFQIVIRRQGYIPFDFSLKGKLESLETYELVVSDEFGTINVTATDAQIWMDNKPVAKDEYSFHEKEGKYIIKATGDKYYEEEKFVSLYAGETIDLKFDLKPKTGTLAITSNPKDTKKTISGIDTYTTIQLDESNKIIKALIEKGPNTKLSFDATNTYTKLPLTIGNYRLQIVKEGFLPYYQDLNIRENQITNVLANMEVDPTIQMLKHKKKKNIWLVSSILTVGVGTYSYLQSEKLYDEYQAATTDAGELHSKIKMYDKIYPVAFGVAGACLIEFIVHAAKQGKAKRKLELHPSYSKGNKGLALSYTF